MTDSDAEADAVPSIPKRIRNVMRDEEVENMLNFDGWATGTVVQTDRDGTIVYRFDDSWIELFNGAGRAGEFGGVRFMSVDDGEYEEAYAYPGRMYANGNYPCYYVETWDEPDTPRIGPKEPEEISFR